MHFLHASEYRVASYLTTRALYTMQSSVYDKERLLAYRKSWSDCAFNEMAGK